MMMAAKEDCDAIEQKAISVKHYHGLMILVSIILGLCLLNGCSRSDTNSAKRNPYFLKATKLKAVNNYQAAVQAYEKCLVLNPDFHEVYLTIAVIYDDHLQDYLKAWYYYRTYLEKVGTTAPRENRKLAEEAIDRVRQALLKQLQKAEGVAGRVDALKEEVRVKHRKLDELQRLYKARSIELEKLENKNTFLKRRLSQLLDQLESVSGAGSGNRPLANNANNSNASSHGGANESAEEIRTYMVKPGDTLSAVSKKFYGTSRKWPFLLRYNSSVLNGKPSLKPGMLLKIPENPN